ncbi:hypothetical protein [Streptomyces microflavus]|uniref:hypothetical protein n=1 Tax=Streptomyces microflavus TaxID=1919 RepID=UPI003652EF16
MGMLPVDDVTSQAGSDSDLLVGDRLPSWPALALPGCSGGGVSGAARSVGDEHQQLDPAQGVYGTAGRPGQELDSFRTVGVIGLGYESLDFSGEHVDVAVLHTHLLLVGANGIWEAIAAALATANDFTRKARASPSDAV